MVNYSAYESYASEKNEFFVLLFPLSEKFVLAQQQYENSLELALIWMLDF